jgi:hypothetical protein
MKCLYVSIFKKCVIKFEFMGGIAGFGSVKLHRSLCGAGCPNTTELKISEAKPLLPATLC